MSRILLTWELGMNLGHLARLLPVAVELKARGHMVLVAVREVPAAAALFGPAEIAFVPAPAVQRGLPPQIQMSSYADILLAQGWCDPQVLTALVRSWLNVYEMFRPDAVVHGHSPTAQLAMRCARISTVMLANGFECPPGTTPLPPFPAIPWASREKSVASEERALDSANAAMLSCNAGKLSALRDLFDCSACLMTTLPEFDHYGERAHANYIGPLRGELRTERVEWPNKTDDCARVFAYLRPETPNLHAILGALQASNASVVCVAPGFDRKVVESTQAAGFRCLTRLVDLRPLVSEAAICLSHGGEGTMAEFLLAGVPQLVAPSHVETYLAAKRIEVSGAGLTLGSEPTAETVAAQIERLLHEPSFRIHAKQLSSRYRTFNAAQAAAAAVNVIEGALGSRGT